MCYYYPRFQDKETEPLRIVSQGPVTSRPRLHTQPDFSPDVHSCPCTGCSGPRSSPSSRTWAFGKTRPWQDCFWVSSEFQSHSLKQVSWKHRPCEGQKEKGQNRIRKPASHLVKCRHLPLDQPPRSGLSCLLLQLCPFGLSFL